MPRRRQDILQKLASMASVPNHTNSLRTSFPRSHVLDDCIFTHILPHPNCSSGSFLLDLTIAFAQIMYGANTTLQVFPVEDWDDVSVDEELRLHNPGIGMGFNNTTVLGAVLKGDTDITAPIRLTVPRALEKREVVLIYQQQIRYGQLSVQVLFWDPAGIWQSLAFLLCLRTLLLKLRLGERVKKFAGQHALAANLAVYLLLSILSNFLCLLFTLEETRHPNFKSLSAFQDKLYKGEMRLILVDDQLQEIVFQNLKSVNPTRLASILARNPPILEPNQTAAVVRMAGEPNLALVALLTYDLQIQLLQKLCDVSSLPIGHSQLMGFYGRPGLHAPPQANLRLVQMRALASFTFPRYTYPRRPCVTLRSHNFDLNIGQVSGVLFGSLLGLISAMALFLLEMSVSWLDKRYLGKYRRFSYDTALQSITSRFF